MGRAVWAARGGLAGVVSLPPLAVSAWLAWGSVTLTVALDPRRSSETVERVEQNEDTTSEK